MAVPQSPWVELGFIHVTLMMLPRIPHFGVQVSDTNKCALGFCGFNLTVTITQQFKQFCFLQKMPELGASEVTQRRDCCTNTRASVCSPAPTLSGLVLLVFLRRQGCGEKHSSQGPPSLACTVRDEAMCQTRWQVMNSICTVACAPTCTGTGNAHMPHTHRVSF